jgi:hypothetical protein
MDYIGQDTFRELLETRQDPAVSIYCEFDHQNRRGKNHRLTYENGVKEAKRLLTDEYEEELVEDVIESLESIADDTDFWDWQSKGLAVFVSPDYVRTIRLGTSVGDDVVVGTNFHTRPLLDLLMLPDRYWVLAIGRGETRLFEGNQQGLEPVDLASVPSAMREALEVDEPRHDTMNRASPDAGSPRQADKASPAPGDVRGLAKATSGSGRISQPPLYHGYGAGEDDEKPHLRSFFTKVDEGLQDMLHGSNAPVILAAPERVASMYRDVSELENLAEQAIEASATDWNESRLHQASWEIAAGLVDERIEEALALWEREYGRGSGEMDLQNIAKRTIQNQVRAIMIERDRHVWGTLDRETGDITVKGEGSDDPSAIVDDLLDELAEYVILRGGQAIHVPPEHIPSDTGAAAILR